MATANELVTKFRFDTGKAFNTFERNLKGAARKVDATTARMGKSFKNMGQDFKRSVKHRMRLKGVNAVKGDLKRLKSLAMGFKASLKGLALGGGIAAVLGGIGLGAAVKDIFSTNVEIAKLKGAMKTATGGGAKFAKEYARIKDFASSTPFALGQSMQAFVKLKNLGLDPSNRALKSYGNTAAAMGKDMSQMIEAVADASTGEFERLKEFGIKSSKQGKDVEFTFNGVKTKIKADSKSIQEYLMGLGETKFAQAMADQMRGLPGIVSNIGDAFTLMKLAIFEGGFEKALIPVLASIRDYLTSLIPAAKKFGEQLGDFTKRGQVFAKLKLVPMLKKIPDILKAMVPWLKAAGVALGVFVAYSIGLRVVGLYSILTQMAVGFMMAGSAGAFAAVGISATAVSAALVAVAVGGVVIALAALAYDFYNFTQTGESALINFAESWLGIGDEIKNIYNLVVAFGMSLGDLGGVVAWWGTFAKGIWFEVTQGYAALKETIAIYTGALIQTMVAKWDLFKAKAWGVWASIVSKAVSAGSSITGAIMGALNGIGSFLAGLPAKAMSAFNGLVKAAVSAAGRMPIIGGAIKAVTGMATGGMVPGGFPHDNFPASLTSGEAVIPVRAVNQIKSGDPAGFSKVAQIVGAGDSMASRGVGSYSMPATSIGGSGSSYATTVQAPINQSITIQEAATPLQTAQAVVRASGSELRKELDFMARQVGRRV